MKRNLLTLTTLVILWIRQLRYERRLSNRQGRWEREVDRRAMKEVELGFKEVDKILVRWHKEIGKAMVRR